MGTLLSTAAAVRCSSSRASTSPRDACCRDRRRARRKRPVRIAIGASEAGLARQLFADAAVCPLTRRRARPRCWPSGPCASFRRSCSSRMPGNWRSWPILPGTCRRVRCVVVHMIVCGLRAPCWRPGTMIHGGASVGESACGTFGGHAAACARLAIAQMAAAARARRHRQRVS